MADHVDCVVIGAGVVGLAIARALALGGREVIVLERHSGIGEETSSRNSEVIHAGIYYPTGTLKAQLCVAGKALLYAYCDRKEVPHRRCGKLIVATANEQIDRLKAVAAQAKTNGVDDLDLIDKTALRQREAEVAGVAALWSPSTGIVDGHAFMQALDGDISNSGGMVVPQSEVQSVHVAERSIRLTVASGGEATELSATTVVNAAGLEAVALAGRCTGDVASEAPRLVLAKGNYFIYGATAPFATLVYPLPQEGGLGIHATLDLDGRLRFGPDVEWISQIDYTVDPSRQEAFAASIRQYWPGLDESSLTPGYAGIRPKLSGPGEPPADFRIAVAAPGAHRQLVHLFGIESPGLTAALALGDEVVRRIETAAA